MGHHPVARLGIFFILIGCLLILLFIGSIFGKQGNGLYLILGALAVFLGSSLHRRFAPPPSTSQRFSILRGLRKSSREQDDGRDSKKDMK